MMGLRYSPPGDNHAFYTVMVPNAMRMRLLICSERDATKPDIFASYLLSVCVLSALQTWSPPGEGTCSQATSLHRMNETRNCVHV